MVVIQQILFVVLIISILLVTTLFQKNILDFSEIRNKSFPTSAYFSALFQESAEDIFNFVELRKKFETEGNYDTEKRIDIQKYYSSQGRAGDISDDKFAEGDGQARYYYLGELVEWARSYTMSEYEFNSSYYIGDGIHQKQIVTREGAPIYNQEKVIATLGDMSVELQELIVSNVEHYYGGSYKVTGMEEGSSASSSITSIEDTAENTDENYLPDIVQKVINGGLYELDSNELSMLLQDMGMEQGSHVSDYNFVDESYFSVEGKGIWNDYIQENVPRFRCKRRMRHWNIRWKI